MHWVGIIIAFMALFPYLAWFFEASLQDWIISIAFIIIYPPSSFVISYLISEGIRKLLKKPMLKHESFEIAYFFTFGTLCLISIVGFIVVMASYYSDPEYRHHLTQPLAGIAIFSTITTIVIFLGFDSFLDYINPFKAEKQNYLDNIEEKRRNRLEKKRKENAIDYLTDKTNILKTAIADWIKANKKNMEKVIKDAKSNKKEIKIRKKHIEDFVEKYYYIPKCKRCNNEESYLVDMNDGGTGIELMCSKCEKKDWLHSNNDDLTNIIDKDILLTLGSQNYKYFYEYISFYDEGYMLYEIYSSMNEDFIQLTLDYQEYLNNLSEYRWEIIDNNDSLNADKLSKQPELLSKCETATSEFYHDEEDIKKNKLSDNDYISFFFDKNKIIEVKRKRPPIPQDVKNAVWNRDGGRCVECGSKDNIEFDHIVPFSKRGSNTWRNLQLLCESCNRKKSDKI